MIRYFLLLLSSLSPIMAMDGSKTADDTRSLASKDEIIAKVLPGQYFGPIVQSTNQPTSDWFFPVQGKGNAVLEEGFVPPIFDPTSNNNDFPALQVNSLTNIVIPVHVIVRQFPSAYHPLLSILGSTRCSVAPAPSASQKLQSRVVLLLNLQQDICSRQSAQTRMNLVRALTQYFSEQLADYWWLAGPPVINDVRLAKMVMTMLESKGSSNEFTDCTLVLPLGCGARVPGNYIDAVVKLQDDFASFPPEIRNSVLSWSVKIFDPLMLPVVSLGDEARKAADNRLLLRNPRNRHRRSAFGLQRGNNFLESYQLSDYVNDESWALENRLAMDASSGDGYQQRPSQPDVFDVLTMVATTTPTSFGDDEVALSPDISSSTVVVPIGSDDETNNKQQSTPLTSYSSIAANDVVEEAPTTMLAPQTEGKLTLEAVQTENFPSLATSTRPPTPQPEFTEGNLFIAQHKILFYPIRRHFETFGDLSEVTFILHKCKSPNNGEPVSSYCRRQTMSTDDWLYFNYHTKALEGIVPGNGADPVYIFNLTGIGKTQTRSFIIRISVTPAAKNPQIADRTHEFCLHLKWKAGDIDSDSASQLRMREQMQVARVLTGLSSKMNLEDVVVLTVGHATESQAAKRHLTSMCFSQVNLTPVDGGKRCPRGQFGKHLGHLVKLPAIWADKGAHNYKFSPSPVFSSALKNNTSYEVQSVGFTLLNGCKSVRMDVNVALNASSEAQIVDGGEKPTSPGTAGDVWLTLVVPGAVLLCMLLLALVVACALYRCIRRKSHGGHGKGKNSRVSVTLGNGNSVFLTKGAPAIFQEELDSEVPGPTRLLISADNRDQFSGGEGSEPGEDTASSSAPGGSPGRTHSSEPNMNQQRRQMVPATPPPPEYRLHHNNRNTGPLALPNQDQQQSSTRHDDASSPESREMSEEMAELSRPLLVKQTMVSSIQTVGTVA